MNSVSVWLHTMLLVATDTISSRYICVVTQCPLCWSETELHNIALCHSCLTHIFHCGSAGVCWGNRGISVRVSKTLFLCTMIIKLIIIFPGLITQSLSLYISVFNYHAKLIFCLFPKSFSVYLRGP